MMLAEKEQATKYGNTWKLRKVFDLGDVCSGTQSPCQSNNTTNNENNDTLMHLVDDSKWHVTVGKMATSRRLRLAEH
jgi:hypothetical protein